MCYFLIHTCRRISIHALRVEGDTIQPRVKSCNSISIHALRVEGDMARPFQYDPAVAISIHALRVEGDRK